MDTIPVWDRNADFWDRHLGEGNAFQLKLIMPATDRLLGDVAGKAILDACCGNGNYARKLAGRGATVTAFDGSRVFIEKAVGRTPAGLAVSYDVIDATNDDALAVLGEGRFDATVCSMAMMDLAEIDPLLRAVRRALKPGGVFVFSVPHPAFNSYYARPTADLVNIDGRMTQRFGMAVDGYLSPMVEQSEGILNQPEPHPLFHRPIGLLLSHCFAAGFVVTALEEPAFPPDTPAKNAFSWAKRPEIPPALVVRLS
jgi:SAM-dependent methyltransferase